MGVRIESDSMGNIEVPAERYWGAQTQRSMMNFAIGEEKNAPALDMGVGCGEAGGCPGKR